MVKIPMLTYEIAFLGWQFSLLRSAVTLPVFIALACLLERLLPDDVSIREAQEKMAGEATRQTAPWGLCSASEASFEHRSAGGKGTLSSAFLVRRARP